MIESLLVNRTFKSCIRKSAKYTQKTGYEAGFLVGKKSNDSLAFSKVVKGTVDSIMTFEKKPSFSVEGEIHFHPCAKELIMPALEDLDGLVWKFFKEKKTPPYLKWIIIGRVDGKTVTLLFLRAHNICESDIREWSLMIDEMNHLFFSPTLQNEINKSLEEIGFEVKMVTMNL